MPRRPRDSSSVQDKLKGLVALLKQAVANAPAARYFWGVVAAAATVAIISVIIGLNRLSFVAVVAVFVAMFVFFVFSRIEKSNDIVIKGVGYLLLVVSCLAFCFFVVATAWFSMTCQPRMMAYIYGVSDYCSQMPATPDRQSKATTKLFRDYARRYGHWQGVDEITEAQARHLGRFFEFAWASGNDNPHEVRVKNGSGACAETGFSSATGDKFGGDCSIARACRVDFKYKDDGTIDQETVFDQFDNAIEELQFTSSDLGQFLNAKYPCDHGRSGIRQIDFHPIESGANKGYEEVELFLDSNRQPRPNDAGSYGVRFAYDSDHHVVQATNLGPHNENWVDREGVSIVRLTYNKVGLRELQTYLAPDERTTFNTDGIAQERTVYDQWGNPAEVDYLDATGKPKLGKDGYAGWRASFDEHGNQIEVAYFGTDGKPVLSKDGYAGWHTKFDDQGRQIETAYFGIDGKPTLNRRWIAGWQTRLDERGRPVEVAEFGADGMPVLNKDGYSARLEKYDDRGNTIEDSYVGTDRRPILVEFGAASFKNTFNEQNKRESTRALDTDGHPVTTKEGYAGWRVKLDGRGNELDAIFFWRRRAACRHGRRLRSLAHHAR
jgi:hypothetical protein